VRPEAGLWYSRQQAAWPGQQHDLQSGDQSPHSKRFGGEHVDWENCGGKRFLGVRARGHLIYLDK